MRIAQGGSSFLSDCKFDKDALNARALPDS